MKTVFRKDKKVVSKLFGEGYVDGVVTKYKYPYPVVVIFKKSNTLLNLCDINGYPSDERRVGNYSKTGEFIGHVYGVNDVISLIKK